MAEKIEDLLGRYWGLAYREGSEGRKHDTLNGDAQATAYAIVSAFHALEAALESMRVQVALVSDPAYLARAIDSVGLIGKEAIVEEQKGIAKFIETHQTIINGAPADPIMPKIIEAIRTGEWGK